MSNSLLPHELQPTRLFGPWDFPGMNTGVGCHFLLQGIFPTQGLNPGLPYCRQMLHYLSYQGSPNQIMVIINFTLYPLFSYNISARQHSYCTNRCLKLSGIGVRVALSIPISLALPMGLWDSSVQFSSVAQSCLTRCNPMNRRTPGLPVHHKLPEFTQTHVHRVSDAIQPSHPLSSPSPPAPNPSQHQSLFQ